MTNSVSDLSTHDGLVCSRCESPLEPGDLRCAICGQAAPVKDAAAPHTVTVTILRCTGCGAAVRYDPKHQAPMCPFCGEAVKVESIEDPLEQTEHYLPFTVTPEQARDTLREWLGSRGWFRPADLSASAQLLELKPLWWVAWMFDAEALISWTADSNAGAGRSSWAPHSGQNDVRFDDILVSASRGLSDHEVSAIRGGFDLSVLQDTPIGGGEDATLEHFDMHRSQARQYVSSAIERLAADRVQQHSIPGSVFRNVNVAVVVRKLVTHRISLPAYVLAYRYRNELYRVVICGQNQRLVIGTSPLSMPKVVFVVILAIVLIALFFAAAS
ncbi:hypothetical protein NHH03_25020 [Stieleria sp. TO1_6]|uniref:hypothetical protein n=1 Tax=Stieleria tagensis TaxID=2956795 RepID=UPI00209ACB50|nr:hypothetical protein [Stieleria tagensis]MCO8125023.1 hypothetical protein [Stieleria tagensis]